MRDNILYIDKIYEYLLSKNGGFPLLEKVLLYNVRKPTTRLLTNSLAESFNKYWSEFVVSLNFNDN